MRRPSQNKAPNAISTTSAPERHGLTRPPLFGSLLPGLTTPGLTHPTLVSVHIISKPLPPIPAIVVLFDQNVKTNGMEDEIMWS